ncbi:hypothetical protein JCM33374_g836 [Metschnikowia sp. JCM 33374]|nr:hypothetical protein JCM33374_g836 [Metschnikowia sp. JCM 33374]
MPTLTVAAKAPFIAYSSIIASEFVKAESDASLAVEFVDEKTAHASSDVSVAFTIDDKVTAGEPDVLQVLASLAPSLSATAKSSATWVQFALDKLANKNFKALAAELEILEAHLNFRSFILGHEISLADIAVWGVLRSNGVMVSLLKNETYINVSRWYNFIAIDSKFDVVEKTTKSINDMRKSAKASKGEKKETHKANFAIDLPNAEMGKVVTRFPPEPSGYLHIGHVKAAILNEYFAHEYKGKLIIRFDDTNPSKEKTEFQDAIIEDLALLGIKGDQVTFSSNYFDQMYDFAVQMIKDGNAYCDDTPLEKMREERMVGDASARRERSIEENLKIFTEDMKNGTEEGLKNCLRAKIDYTNPNKALRDPVIYRCNATPHHRTGTQWKMYPTYDFCVPVVDSIEGVTHSLRTNEYRDRNPQYDWIQKSLKLRHVDIWDFGRVNFMRTLLSKRKLQWFVDSGYVGNWDDPRFPTVRGVRRRGMTVEGLRNFILSQGPSKNIINMEWSAIWAMNKKIIDPIAPRHTAIDVKDAVPVTLTKAPESVVTEEKPKHKKNPDVGLKKVLYSSRALVEQVDAASFAEGEEVTFMDWGNVIIKKITKEGDIVKSIDGELHLEGDFRKTEKKVTWLADTDDKTVVELVDFDHLITKDKLEETDNFEDFITPVTEFKGEAFADINVKSLKKGDVIQFERKGYYKVDSDLTEGDKMVFFTIPDGKTAFKEEVNVC